jgi:hypothetical protein
MNLQDRVLQLLADMAPHKVEREDLHAETDLRYGLGYGSLALARFIFGLQNELGFDMKAMLQTITAAKTVADVLDATHVLAGGSLVDPSEHHPTEGEGQP